ncbi:aminotransferase class I/II-fold pyridoxal phosphate-dependent enzyme [Thalassomonas haliotis]|uniref:8-amino-7-oxononanoate synthase n=1 Tax=Thalassomonas haliotis TaxID=485448 RepID=A0ABY7VKV9_9GAMM|nr:8-amino-7-oxononanoate synthase [Thalassomonas haliotis]WDE14236.1 8-amino-7-oxononanoate synthase [Thalassomonas haliotis]
MAFEFINQQLSQRQSQSRYRQRLAIAGGAGREVVISGKSYLNFSSNDYLGLNNHPEINQAMQEGIDRFGLCATGSSLITGFSYAHQVLEQQICQWLNKPRCLLFSSGFAANTGLLQALGQQQCHLLLDKLCHASLIDGALAASSGGKASMKRFRHNDIDQLENFLKRSPGDDNLIVSEGVFSMDGDQAKIKKLSAVAKNAKAWLYLDDAHSIGVIGRQGQGSVSQGNVDIVMATFGKAIASSGAFIACEENLFEYLVNFSRHYIYSTAISPAVAWATVKSIELIQKEQWRRDKIAQLSFSLSQALDPRITLAPTESSIHALIIGDEKSALSVSEKLKKKGIWLTAIRPPTVPVNSSRLRVTICASHNDNDIKYLAACLNEALG